MSAALVTAWGGSMLPAAAAATAAVTPAPVLDGADAGGPVIVWMKDQHKNLNLRTQGAQRIAAAHSDQASIVSDIKSHGGTDITQLVSVNAVAAHLSADEVKRLSQNPGVSQIVPDAQVEVEATAAKTTVDDPAPMDPALCPSDPAKPLLEPEALADIHYQSDDPNAPRMASSIATGKGVLIGIDGMNSLAGNPNFTRADGSHVVIGAPDYTKDKSNDEAYGDASSIGAQGTVVYDFAKELPYSGLPTGCTFVLKGDAPDASLVDAGNMDTPESIAGHSDSGTKSESQIVAGIDNAVTKYHVDVISESYGYSPRPGSYKTHWAANDAAVAAGVTVVVSSGDSGVSGTISSPADDPQVIGVGATNTLRLNAQAYGYTGWGNGDITPLSSGGVTPNNKVVDLVAPGYGGQAACNPAGSGCPTNTSTEAFGGTSQSAPFVAGAAADVIQAYRDSHNGTSPTPAMVKQILTGTATDIGAPADQQGAGLLDIYAAVKAAQQMPGSTLTGGGDSPSLVTPQTQLDLTGTPGSTNDQTVQLYNTSDTATTVTGSYRSLGAPTQIGDVVTENVSAPDPSLPVAAEGATAAAPVTFTVPAGLDRLDADMIWPDATNGAVLSFTLVDPKGRLRQISYDYGTPSTKAGKLGTVPNLQHTEVAHPEAGKWTAKILWANGRSHLQDPPNVPGTYTGSVSFKASGRHFVTAPASGPVVVPAHGSADVPLHIAMPAEPGDHPQSVQFTASNGAATSLPMSRRSLIPAAGGAFDTLITSTVGRDQGQTSTFNFPVAAGRKDLTVTFQTDDASANNPYTFYLVDPNGKLATSVGSAATTVDGVTKATGTLHVANPAAGMWEIDVKLNLTVSGKEFTQVVHGNVAPDASAAPVITSPADGSISGGKTPAIAGTGGAGATIKVTDESGKTVCTATVAADGSWSCTPAADLAPGSHTLTANQTDGNGNTTTSPAVGVTIAYGSATEKITTTVTQQGGLTISVDNSAPVVLPTPVLTGDASALTSSGDMNPVTVTDTRTQSPGWNVVGQVGDFTTTTGDTIAAADLGWTPKVLDTATGQTVTPGSTVTPGTSGGLAKSQQLATAGPGTANGTAHVGATLNLLAPTTTKVGTYTATMTLTAI